MVHWTRNHRKRNTTAIKEALKLGIIVVKNDEILSSKGLPLRVSQNSFDYPFVRFYVKGVRHAAYCHKITFMAYGGRIRAGFKIDHIDGNNANYKHENLQLISQEANLEKSNYTGTEPAF